LISLIWIEELIFPIIISIKGSKEKYDLKKNKFCFVGVIDRAILV
jgi:hypothetical protein